MKCTVGTYKDLCKKKKSFTSIIFKQRDMWLIQQLQETERRKKKGGGGGQGAKNAKNRILNKVLFTSTKKKKKSKNKGECECACQQVIHWRKQTGWDTVGTYSWYKNRGHCKIELKTSTPLLPLVVIDSPTSIGRPLLLALILLVVSMKRTKEITTNGSESLTFSGTHGWVILITFCYLLGKQNAMRMAHPCVLITGNGKEMGKPQDSCFMRFSKWGVPPMLELRSECWPGYSTLLSHVDLIFVWWVDNEWGLVQQSPYKENIGLKKTKTKKTV